MADTQRGGIIVLGAPRSGTTMLRRILDAHPGITCPGETFLLKATAKFLESDTIGPGIDYGVSGGLQAVGFDEDEILARLRGLCFGFMDDVARRAGKPRWAIKTAVDSFYLDQVERVYGDHAQFVCLLRNGLDVVASMKEFSDEMQIYVSELHHYVARHPAPLEAFAHAWSDVTTGLLGFAERHPDNAILLRYEDIVDRPEAGLGGLFAFLGEPWDVSILEVASKKRKVDGIGDWKAYNRSAVDRASLDRWQGLPQPTIDRLVKILGTTLTACGYPLPAVAEDEDSERRRELAMALMQSGRSTAEVE